MVINAYGIVLENKDSLHCEEVSKPRNVFLRQILPGVHFGDTAAENIVVRIVPTTVLPCTGRFNGTFSVQTNAGDVNWATGGFCLAWGANQPDVDLSIYFPESSLNKPILLSQQCKLQLGKGVVLATYNNALKGLERMANELSWWKPGNKTLHHVFGVVDPVKKISTVGAKSLVKQLPKIEVKGVSFFAVGRMECFQYFGCLGDHPFLIPRFFVNDPTLTPAMLALGLPESWTHREERAKIPFSTMGPFVARTKYLKLQH